MVAPIAAFVVVVLTCMVGAKGLWDLSEARDEVRILANRVRREERERERVDRENVDLRDQLVAAREHIVRCERKVVTWQNLARAWEQQAKGSLEQTRYRP